MERYVECSNDIRENKNNNKESIIRDKIAVNENRSANLELLEDLCEALDAGSLCAMGGLTPMPVRSAVKYFSEDFSRMNEAKR